MAVEQIQPEDSDDQAVVELVLVDGGDDAEDTEGAPTPGRLRAFWDQCLADADADRTGAPRALALPSIHQYLVPVDTTKDSTLAGILSGLAHVPVRTWRGLVIIVRWVRRRPWKPKAKATPKAAPAKAKKGKAKAAPKAEGESVPTEATAAAPAAKAKGEGRGGNLVALFLFGGMGLTALGGYVDVIVNVAQYGVVLLLVVAWAVGGVAQLQDEAAAEEPEAEAPEDAEPDEVADAEDDLGETDDQAPVDDGGQAPGEPHDDSPEAARVRVYEWVRKAIGTNKGVHLRELLLDVQSQPGGEGMTMPQLKAHLAAHGIAWRESQKAPASDKDGRKINRPGVNVDDLPKGYAPIETPGSNLVRLLPTYQGSDQG
jgi:hypothetical protein